MRRRDRTTAFIALAALALGVLGVGGALRWVQGVVCALIALALIVQLPSHRRLSGLSPLVAVIGMAAILTALQLIPLPEAWMAVLDPTGADLRATGAKLAGVPTWNAITLDLPGTLRGLTFLLTLLGAAVVALRFSASDRGRHVVLGAVAALCGVTALIVGIHELFSATSLYGVYEPVQATPTVLGPLLNPNHLGCLMSMGAVLSIGLFFYHRQSTAARVFWALCGAGCVAVSAATLSRGAALAGAGGVCIVLMSILSQRWSAANKGSPRTRRKFLVRTLPTAIVITCGLFVMVYTGAGAVAQQIADTSLQEIQQPASKYAAWRSSTELVDDSPWVGIGRGALEPAFTRVHPASAFVTFSHLENEYIQAVVEWGIPGAVILAALLAWLGWTAVRKWRDGPLAASALGALAVVAAQSNVDFGFELLGIALPTVAIAATLTYVPLREMASGGRIWRARMGRGALLGVLGFAATLLFHPVTRSVAEDHLGLKREHPGDEIPLERIREVIARHPLDYYSFAIGSQELRHTDLPAAIRYLNHALILHPTHPGLHQRAANLLIATGRRQQAALEYSTAIEGSLVPLSLLRELVTALPKAEDAASAIPVDYANIEAVVQSLASLDRNDVTIAWLALVLQEHPHELRVIDHLYALAMDRGDNANAELAARARLELGPTDSRSRLDLARVLSHEAKWDDVAKLVDDVDQWHGRVEDINAAWMLKCDAIAAHETWDPAIRCLHLMDAAGVIMIESRQTVMKKLDSWEQSRKAQQIGAPPPTLTP